MAEQLDRRHSAGHQPDHLNVKAILWFIGALIGGSFAIWLLLGGLWYILGDINKQEATTSAWDGQRQLPPAPRLQTQGNIDLQSYLDQQGKRLNSYGEDGAGTGSFHVPIDKAIDLVIQQGLPARSSDQTRQAPKENERNANDPAAH